MDTDAESLRDTLRITCADAVELTTHFLEDALAPADRERFQQHLDNCEACTVYLDQIRRTITIVGRTAGSDDYVVDEASMDLLVELFRARAATTDTHGDPSSPEDDPR